MLSETLDDETCKLINSNLINVLFAANSTDNCIMYIQSSASLFIFNKKIFSEDFTFFQDYFIKTTGWNEIYKFQIMNPDCELYKEHKRYFKNKNILLFKYSNHGNMIYKTTITKEGKNIYTEGHYIGSENYHFTNDLRFIGSTRRKILPGITVQDYIECMPIEQQRIFLKKFFDWLFATYASKNDTNKLNGILVDCHLNNFIINNGKFILIDSDFISGNLDKNVCLWYALWNGKHPLYNYFLDLYNLKEPNESTHPLIKENVGIDNAGVLNKNLLNKYFSNRYLVPNIQKTSNNNLYLNTKRKIYLACKKMVKKTSPFIISIK